MKEVGGDGDDAVGLFGRDVVHIATHDAVFKDKGNKLRISCYYIYIYIYICLFVESKIYLMLVVAYTMLVKVELGEGE